SPINANLGFCINGYNIALRSFLWVYAFFFLLTCIYLKTEIFIKLCQFNHFNTSYFAGRNVFKISIFVWEHRNSIYNHHGWCKIKGHNGITVNYPYFILKVIMKNIKNPRRPTFLFVLNFIAINYSIGFAKPFDDFFLGWA